MRIKTLAARILIVIFAPAIFLVVADSILRLTGAFEPVRLLEKVRHKGTDHWTTNPAFTRFVLKRKESPVPPELLITARKEPDRLRVVLVGESAAAGFPGPQFNLGRIVQALWNNKNPTKPIEVINLSMVGVNSNILRLVVREAMQLEPDALVVYAGHNEAIGPYGPAAVFGGFVPSPWLVQASLAVRNTRLGRFLESMMDRIRADLACHPSTKWRGLDEFAASRIEFDDPRLDKMAAQSSDNFESIIRTSLEAGCKVLICVPAANLTDWPPMASDLDAPRNALLLFGAGNQLLAEGKSQEGWKKLREACDLDLVRIRADSRIRKLQQGLATRYPPDMVQVIDSDEWLHELNDTPYKDRELFFEHVHLTMEGRIAVACLIVDGLQDLLGVPATTSNLTWSRFPETVDKAKALLLFTPYSEVEMLRAITSLLRMKFFAFAPDITPRQERFRELETEALELAEAGWNADRFRATYREAVALSPKDPLVDITAAGTWKAVGDEDSALESLQQALAKNPLSYSARMGVATRYAELGQIDKVRHQLGFLERQQLGSPGSNAALGQLLNAVGETKKAVEKLQANADENPASVAAWTNLAMAQEKDGDINGAIASYDLSLKIDPLDAYSLHNSSRLILSKSAGDHEQQLQALYRSAKASDLEPNNKAYRRQLIAVLQALGRTDQAQIEKDRLDAVK